MLLVVGQVTTGCFVAGRSPYFKVSTTCFVSFHASGFKSLCVQQCGLFNPAEAVLASQHWPTSIALEGSLVGPN